MDALKHIPDNVNVLKTERGDARLQKTDIFKKLMWFSYPREEAWIPLPISRVKEIQQMNRDGVIPADLGEIIEEENIPAKALDYENVVGQDSLTRLDERRNNNKKKNKNRNKNSRPNGPGENNPQRSDANTGQGPQQARPQGNRPPDGNRQDGNSPQGNRPPDGNRQEGNNRNQRFRPNRNNNNPNRPANDNRDNNNQQDKPQ